MHRAGYGFFLALVSLAGGSLEAAEPLDFARQIRPILSDRCFACHGPDASTRKAGLRLDSREAAIASGAIVPGKSQESELIRRIEATDADRMPPASSHLTLSSDERELLKRWIAEGAIDRPHWAFIPLPDRVAVPEVHNAAWPRDTLDQFILARLEKERLSPAAPASREMWLRRITFDLTGLPPSPSEIDHFLLDQSSEAKARVVDRLLASTRHAERMTLDWLDLARYADSFGYQADGDMNVWPYRDWVISAFQRNMPFDQFLTWQLAGDLLPKATRAQRLATTFNRLHRMTNEGGSIPEEFRNESVADRVSTLGTALLGLTLECCRCHDHKFDPLTLRDFYGLSAFFNNLDEWGTYDSARYVPTPTLLLPTPEQEANLARQESQVRQWESRLKELPIKNNEVFERWLSDLPREARIQGCVAHYPLDTIEPGGKLANTIDPKQPGSTTGGQRLVPGIHGQALELNGDDSVHFPGSLGTVERSQPFSVAFHLFTPRRMSQGIVFHRQAGTDTGFHGTELAFNDGRLVLALVRFWPGNMAAIRTREPFAVNRWQQIVVSSDGSGRTAGLAIHIDGKPVSCDVIRDNLNKNIEGSAGHGGVPTGLSFGARFRSVGLKECRVDDVRFFDRPLTSIESAQLFDGHSLSDALANRDRDALKTFYFAVIDPEGQRLRRELAKARQEWFATQTSVNEIMTMREMEPRRPAFVLQRGSYESPEKNPVERQTPAALWPFPKDLPRDRLGLARWLTDPHHPLTARVIVNRYWQLFFGRGLVSTPENFGVQGSPPSHPELLDGLARDFIDSGWDLRRLCRRIALSATYAQQSACSPELLGRDPENRLLARGPSRRLPAEMLRDSALACGGLLVETVGGPPVKPYQPPGQWRGQNAFLPEYVADRGPGLHRRSMYTFWRRTSPPVNMVALDAPGREVCAPRRSATNTPLQPLVLLNDPQFVEAARGLGERMLAADPKDRTQQLRFGFRAAATREPTARELELLKDLFEDQWLRFRRDPESAKRFLAIGEYKPAGERDPSELAAMAAVAGAILNLDAALTTR